MNELYVLCLITVLQFGKGEIQPARSLKIFLLRIKQLETLGRWIMFQDIPHSNASMHCCPMYERFPALKIGYYSKTEIISKRK